MMSDAYSEFQALCAARKSVRSFSAQPVAAEQIEAIRAVARTAPYASGKKNWELRVVSERAVIEELAAIVRRRSAELGEQVRDDYRPLFLDYADHFAAFAAAPVLFVPVYRVQPALSLLHPAADAAILAWERDNVVKSIAGVALLVQLAAQSLGLGACIMTGPLLAEAELVARLKLHGSQQIGAIVPVGYPLGG